VPVSQPEIVQIAQTQAVEAIPQYSPRYLGRYSASHPSSYNNGDWWLVYDTDDSPIQRGVWYSNNGTPTRITTSSSADLQGKLVAALADIAWAEANGYGKATNYGGFDTFFTALGAVNAFIQNLFAQNIILQTAGYLKSHDYAESGGFPTAGFMLDVANQIIKGYGATFVNTEISGKATLRELVISNISAGTNPIRAVFAQSFVGYVTLTAQNMQICASGSVRAHIEASRNGASTGWDLAVLKNGTTIYSDYKSVAQDSIWYEYNYDLSVVAGDVIKITFSPLNNNGAALRNTYFGISEQPGILSFIGNP